MKGMLGSLDEVVSSDKVARMGVGKEGVRPVRFLSFSAWPLDTWATARRRHAADVLGDCVGEFSGPSRGRRRPASISPGFSG